MYFTSLFKTQMGHFVLFICKHKRILGFSGEMMAPTSLHSSVYNCYIIQTLLCVVYMRDIDSNIEIW
jgi:hypothetical protein